MYLAKNPSAFFSVFFIISFLGLFSGDMPNHVSGLSPYYAAIGQWEERVFQRMKTERVYQEAQYENAIKTKIFNVILNYNTGLDREYLKKVPGWIVDESKKYGYDPLFLTALIVAESSFNNWARSNRGAIGLMQIRPRTGHAMASEAQIKWIGKPTLYDPNANIALGAFYLNKLVQRFGDLSLALEAYNHGPSRLNRFINKGKYPKRYSQKVLRIYNKIRNQSI